MHIEQYCTSHFEDLTDLNALRKVIRETQPDIIFHLAAQSLVRYSYANPMETFQTNVIGTANLLESCRLEELKTVIINVTSDKCYENREDKHAFTEEDRMGGFDPYSCSKGISELLTNCYRNSFFNQKKKGSSNSILVASARAGNVIGGGDWAEDRLIPDVVRAASNGEAVEIRSPNATRPWQHVLEPLSGYLLLGQRLLEDKSGFAEAWNFGPLNRESLPVSEVLHIAKEAWAKVSFHYQENKDQPHEANFLSLDCSKSNQILDWKPVWSTAEAIHKTIIWYQSFYQNNEILSLQDLLNYSKKAEAKGCSWAINTSQTCKPRPSR